MGLEVRQGGFQAFLLPRSGQVPERIGPESHYLNQTGVKVL